MRIRKYGSCVVRRIWKYGSCGAQEYLGLRYLCACAFGNSADLLLRAVGNTVVAVRMRAGRYGTGAIHTCKYGSHGAQARLDTVIMTRMRIGKYGKYAHWELRYLRCACAFLITVARLGCAFGTTVAVARMRIWKCGSCGMRIWNYGIAV